MTMTEKNPPRSSAARRRSARASAVRWLRKTHGWIGLWGAVLGLLFGITGILQNHRAVLKIPTPRPQESTVQLPLPVPAPGSADAMATWLQDTLALERRATRVRSEEARPVAWGDMAITQPGHWMATFSSPRVNVQADYWMGNDFVTVKRSDNGALATLVALHKAVGVGPGWILLADTVAGSLVLLSLSGIALWLLTHSRRTLGLTLLGVSLAASAGIVWVSL